MTYFISMLKEGWWGAWLMVIGICILTMFIGYVIILIHDQLVVINKAHDNWYNAWKNDITNENSCVNLKNLIDDEEGKWIHSELYSLVEKRMGELKC